MTDYVKAAGDKIAKHVEAKILGYSSAESMEYCGRMLAKCEQEAKQSKQFRIPFLISLTTTT